MGLFEHFPYTNFHDLNLNWIIGKIKNIETAETTTGEYAEAAAESAAASHLSADAASASAEASQRSAEASQTSAEASADSAASIDGKAQQIDVNTARLDNLIVDGTPTEGNTELLDIRVDAHGYTYPTAGDAVRGQFTEAEHDLLNYRLGRIDLVIGTWTSDGITVGTQSNQRIRSKYIQELQDVYAIKIPDGWQAYLFYLDADNVLINTPAWNTGTIYRDRFPETAVKFNVNFRKIGETTSDISGYINDLYAAFKLIYIPNEETAEYIKRAVTGSNTLINNASLLVEPYTDLNTVPANEIVSYTISAGLPAHVPDNFSDITGYTVITLNRSIDKSFKSATVQLLIGRVNAEVSNMFYRFSWGTDPAASGAWSTWTMINKNAANQPEIDPSIFGRIAVIGDSFASGISDDSQGGNYYYSWLQMICREYGCTGNNYARGGLTSRTWLTSQYGLSKMQADPVSYNLYFIALGINDSNPDSRNVPVGNLSDFDAVSDIPDTFYGNMGRIYRAVKAKDPNAAVCYITPQRNGERYSPYQDAVAAIAEHIGCLLIRSENTSLYKTRWWINNLSATSHPTVPLYNAMANCIVAELSNAIIDNVRYLQNYPASVN